MVGMLMLRIPRRFWDATTIRFLLLCSFLTLVSYVGGRAHALRLSFGLRLQGSRSTFVPMFVRTIVAFDLGCPTFSCHPLLQGQIVRWDERESPPVGWVGLHLNETGWHGRKGGKEREREREWTCCVSVPSVVGCQRSFLFSLPMGGCHHPCGSHGGLCCGLSMVESSIERDHTWCIAPHRPLPTHHRNVTTRVCHSHEKTTTRTSAGKDPVLA